MDVYRQQKENRDVEEKGLWPLFLQVGKAILNNTITSASLGGLNRE